MTRLEVADQLELRDLAYRYAEGVDRRDTATFLSVFAPDARVHVYNADEPEHALSDMRGHDALAQVPTAIARYPRTFHFVGNTRYEPAGDGARGEVYCTAHHLTVGAERSTDLVLYIRYTDRYRRDGGCWKIADRRVTVDWTGTHDVGPPFGTRRARTEDP